MDLHEHEQAYKKQPTSQEPFSLTLIVLGVLGFWTLTATLAVFIFVFFFN